MQQEARIPTEKSQGLSPEVKADRLLQFGEIIGRIRKRRMGPPSQKGHRGIAEGAEQSTTLDLWQDPERAGEHLTTGERATVADTATTPTYAAPYPHVQGSAWGSGSNP